MKIVQQTWYYDAANRNLEEESEYRCLYYCSVCKGALQSWYNRVLYSLRKFLPENFEPLCCGCAVFGALTKKGVLPSNYECPECLGTIIFRRKNDKDSWYFVCLNCEKVFCTLTSDEIFKLTGEYLRSLY